MLFQALDRIKKAAPKKESKRGDKDKAASSTKKDKAGPSISEDDVKRLEKEVSFTHSDNEGSHADSILIYFSICNRLMT